MELRVNNFRISNIIKFDGFIEDVMHTITCPDKDGLAIEKESDEEKDNWFVVSFIKPSKEGIVQIEEVGTRVIDNVTPDNYYIYRRLCRIAVDIVDTLNSTIID